MSKINPSISGIYNCCLENGLYRNSFKEGPACKIIMSILMALPLGGSGLLIGTPTALCVHSHAKSKQLVTDNYVVAMVLKVTTLFRPLTIVIGNAVNPLKAQVKADHWKSCDMTSDSEIILDKVGRDAFSRHVSVFAEKNDIAKVILMTSGLWNCSPRNKKKYAEYGIEPNFKDPSEYLTSVYKNLHIIALTKEGSSFDFSVRYLHNGINKIIKIPKKGT
jgi:hypothetical protein